MNGTTDTLFDGFPVCRGSNAHVPHVILYSQVRLLRNLDGRLFPNRAETMDLATVRGDLWQAAESISDFDAGWAFEAERTDKATATALVQAGYVDEGWSTRDMAGVMVSAIRDVALVANTDDHLSLNVFRPGVALREALRVAEEIVSSMAQSVVYSRHAQIGYLTANLADAGLGLRIGTALHVPVLRMSGRIRPIVRGLEALGFSVTNSSGTMGKLEDDVLKVWFSCGMEDALEESIAILEKETERLQELELDARRQMVDAAAEDLFDRVSRCYGVLRQAYRLTHLDTRRFFSGLRLGIDLGMFASLDHASIDRLERDCSEYALLRELKKSATLRDVETARARHVKRTLDLLR